MRALPLADGFSHYVRRLGLGLALAMGLFGCELLGEAEVPEVPGGPEEEIPTVSDPDRPVLEASSRRLGPIAVCTKGLAPPRRAPANPEATVVRSLDPEEWVGVMIPEFDPAQGLAATSVDCSGQYVFANDVLRFGISENGWPQVIDPDAIDMRSGPGGLQAVRLRTVLFKNGDWGGPVALVRAVDDRAEVYGMGSYRGPVSAKLRPVKMGNETLLVAEAKRCVTANVCRKVADMFLVRRGRLVNAATIDVERTQRVPSVTQRGLYAEYKLTTDIEYTPQGVQLLEQVQVRIIPYEDGERDSNRLLRKAEFSRLLKVDRDTLFSTNESLWERVVGQD